MTTTPEHDARIANMTFASVYPHYVTKAEKKGRTKAELHEVIEWLTGFDENKLNELIARKATFTTFFEEAKLNPNAELIKGVICGYRIEEIETPLTRQVAIWTSWLMNWPGAEKWKRSCVNRRATPLFTFALH
jgi:hypothetical protein